MKSLRNHFFLVNLLYAFFLASCEQQPAIEFEEPQPAGVKNATEFKKKFRGDYLSLEDSSVMRILPKMLLRTNAWKFRIAKNEIDTMKSWKISGQKLFGPDFRNGVTFQLHNDSVHFTLNATDTLFRIIDDNKNKILRFYKGRYYLNQKSTASPNRWQLSSLGFNKDGKLLYSAITDSTDLKNMQEITEVENVLNEEGKIVAHIARPARKEFKNFIKKGGFHKYEEFVRIK